MRRRILRRHIWGFAVCLCPTKRTQGFYCLIRPRSTAKSNIRMASYYNHTVLVQASKRQRLPIPPLLLNDKCFRYSIEEIVEIFSRPALFERRVLDVRIDRIGHATGTQSPYYYDCCRLQICLRCVSPCMVGILCIIRKNMLAYGKHGRLAVHGSHLGSTNDNGKTRNGTHFIEKSQS